MDENQTPEKENPDEIPKCFISCPQCGNVPVVTLINPKEIKMECSCEYKEEMKIPDFLAKIENGSQIKEKCFNEERHSGEEKIAEKFCINCQKWFCHDCFNFHDQLKMEHQTAFSSIQFPIYCKKHNNRNNDSYCLNCNEYFCNFCLQLHIGHDVKNKINAISENEFHKIMEEYPLAVKKVNEYNEKIKNDITELLKAEITKIQNAFEENKKTNENLIKCFEVLMKNYVATQNLFNYQIINNFKENSSFNLSEFSIPSKHETNVFDQVQKLMNYYEKDFIINTRIKPILKFKDQHSDYIRNILILHDGRLASCGDDKKIRIYNMNTFECEIVVGGHRDYIYYLSQLDDGRLISCSSDRSIKFWTLSANKCECLKSINSAHSDTVNMVIPLTEHRIVSCSDDMSIKIWSDQSYDCLVIFNRNLSKVKAVLQLKDGRLVSSEYNTFPQSVIFWDLSEYEAETSIKGVGCSTPNAICEYDENKILIGCDKEIKIIDTNSYDILLTVKCVGYIYSCLSYKNGNALFGCHGLIYEYNFNTKNGFEKVNVHDDNIIAIHDLSDKIIITASFDHSLKLWKYEGAD